MTSRRPFWMSLTSNFQFSEANSEIPCLYQFWFWSSSPDKLSTKIQNSGHLGCQNEKTACLYFYGLLVKFCDIALIFGEIHSVTDRHRVIAILPMSEFWNFTHRIPLVSRWSKLKFMTIKIQDGRQAEYIGVPSDLTLLLFLPKIQDGRHNCWLFKVVEFTWNWYLWSSSWVIQGGCQSRDLETLVHATPLEQ